MTRHELSLRGVRTCQSMPQTTPHSMIVMIALICCLLMYVWQYLLLFFIAIMCKLVQLVSLPAGDHSW